MPEDLRCKRSDGKQWRCGAPSVPGKTVCEKHYVQAKRRSASSALRATLRSSASAAGGVPATPFRSAAATARLHDGARPGPPPMAVARPVYNRVAGERVYVAEPVPAPAWRGPAYDGLPLGNAAGARSAAVSLAAASCYVPPCAQLGSRCCWARVDWAPVITGAGRERPGVVDGRRPGRDDELPPVSQDWGRPLVLQLRQERLLCRLHLEMVCGAIVCQ